MNQDIVARAERALYNVTPGPWNHHDFGHAGESEPSSIVVFQGEKFDWQAVYDGNLLFSTDWDSPSNENAEFVCKARDLMPELVAEVKRLRALAASTEILHNSALRGEREHGDRWQKLAGSYDDVRYALRNAPDTPEGHAEFYNEAARLIFGKAE